MDLSANTRALYIPVQPSVKQSAADVTYHEFLPHPGLQPFIYCYWQLKTVQPLSALFNYRVVADGCIDIFFELDNSRENFVMGLCKKYTKFTLANTFNYIGVRFLPTMFPRLFHVNAADLSNRTEILSAVIPQTAAFITNSFGTGQCLKEIAALFDNYFLEVLSKIDRDTDPRL